MSSTKVKGRIGKHLDFYETPEKTIQSLLNKDFMVDGLDVLEPCVGSGAIVRIIKKNYPNSKLTMVEIQKDLCFWNDNIINEDFFKLDFTNKFDRIIVNPPFSQAVEFIEKCMTHLRDDGSMAFLLRLSFLASIKRYKFFRKYYPSSVLILTQRPKFGSFTNTDSCDYAWVIWKTKELFPICSLSWCPPL